MIDIQKNFDTTTISDVAFAALETFAESGCDLIYLQDIHTELQKHGHWLLQLQWLFFKMEKKGKLLPYENIESNINLLDIYNSERNLCNKIRLTCQINPICSNVLFNNKTEIVKYNGSDKCICLNYETNLKEDETIGKEASFAWNQLEGIRDTQLSNSACGYDYYCGIDIFNNHILRNHSFKCSISLGDKSDDFNTIFDSLKDDEGEPIVGYTINNPNEEIKLHLYLKEELDSFDESKENNLIEKNGWFGFTNSLAFLISVEICLSNSAGPLSN
jgi:hypothetical protein